MSSTLASQEYPPKTSEDSLVFKNEPIVGLDMEQAARVVGVSKGTLQYWEDTGVYSASFIDPREHRPVRRMYSFRDLVSLKAIARCRQGLDIKLDDIRLAGNYLRRFYEHPWSSLKFGRVNNRLVFWDPVARRWSAALDGSPTLFDFEDIPSEVTDDISKVLKRDPSTHGKISQHRYIKGNQPTIAGTRIPVATIVRYHNAGYSVDEIMTEYPDLTPADVAVALDPSLEHRSGAA